MKNQFKILIAIAATILSSSAFALTTAINTGACVLPKTVNVNGQDYMIKLIPLYKNWTTTNATGEIMKQMPFLVENAIDGRLLLNIRNDVKGNRLDQRAIVGWGDAIYFEQIPHDYCRSRLDASTFLSPAPTSLKVAQQNARPLYAKMGVGGCVESRASKRNPAPVFSSIEGEQSGELYNEETYTVTAENGQWMQIAVARGNGDAPRKNYKKKLGWVLKENFGIASMSDCNND